MNRRKFWKQTRLKFEAVLMIDAKRKCASFLNLAHIVCSIVHYIYICCCRCYFLSRISVLTFGMYIRHLNRLTLLNKLHCQSNYKLGVWCYLCIQWT